MKNNDYFIIAVDYMRSVYDGNSNLCDALGCAIGECYHNKVAVDIGNRMQRFEEAKRMCHVTKCGMSLTTCIRLYLTKDKCATFSINYEAFCQFYNKEMSDTGIINYMAYLALKSIQGKRKMAKCSNCLWLSRMACSTRIINPNEYPQQVQDLNTKYKCKMLRKKIAGMFGVSFYVPKGAKGWYFSVTHSSDEIVQMLNKQYTQKSEAPF